MYVRTPCATYEYLLLDAQNIGLPDGGLIKGVPEEGIRDNVVDKAHFGKYLRQQPTAGMINPDQPTQHGHYPTRGPPARYNDVGPRFNNNKQVRTSQSPRVPHPAEGSRSTGATRPWACTRTS